MVVRMTEDLTPVTADGPQPENAPATTPPGLSPDLFTLAEQKAPLLAPSASAAPSKPVTTRPLWLAFLASAVVALLSGLLWAGIAIATGYNLGILAIAIGAVTGLTAQWVAGTGIGGFEKGLAGLFAAGAIVVGDYVIFVHEVRSTFGTGYGYLQTHQMSVFINNFGTIVHGFDYFWIAIAAYAAIRTSGGRVVLGMGRRRS
jgi:hypothetical protein